jgi:phage-related protein
MKDVSFLGDSLRRIREFPNDARQDIGFQLDKVQRGSQPDDFKPMPTVGKGVEEIRLRALDGIYRVIYTARVGDRIYVLHAFHKKSQATSRSDIELARKRYQWLRQQGDRK